MLPHVHRAIPSSSYSTKPTQIIGREMKASPRNNDVNQIHCLQGIARRRDRERSRPLRVYLRVYRRSPTLGLSMRRCKPSVQGLLSSFSPTLVRSLDSSSDLTSPMSQASTSTASSRFQAIFDAAMKSYQKQTKTDLSTHPLASQLKSCDSTNAIFAVLQTQIREFDQAHSGDERLTRWLNPTVNVLWAFLPPCREVLLIEASSDINILDVLAELFERIGFFFNRLEAYTEVTPTPAMTDIITDIMVEVLTIFGIATKELRRGSAKKLLRKLAGLTNLEDALKKLDRLTQEEARMALAEVLKITHNVSDGVKVVIEDGKEAKVAAKEAKSIIQQTAYSVDEIRWDQLKQLLRSWLSPADPSTNHNIARKAQHRGTAVWFFRGSVFLEWQSSGSLLWIHGKPGSGKSVICSSVVQDIMAVCEAGSAIMAYFYFDFRDLNKQSCHDLLLSLVTQLSTRSSPYCDILHRVYETHEKGTRQPSDDILKECLKEMLTLQGQGPIFIILDALDECPDSPGIPSPRDEVLQLVKELVDLALKELHICATSRPEVDIRAVLEPLAFRSVSLHDESGQKTDIEYYVRNIVNSPSSMAMRRWRDDDKNLVIETLTERADGMFRWVFCQLDTLRHCFPPNLRQFLNELPETLDETYERMLRGINKAQKDNAHRLLHCLAVAVRPLRVEELAELLAFDFQASNSGGIPTLKDDWRWDDQEEAVLSTCSSLIAVVQKDGSRVVQFSHFSVKEYLTSPRLARSQGDVSRFQIDLESAHTIMTQSCLGTLFRLDGHAGNTGGDGFPLVEYAAEHWVEHARFENVSSRVRDGIDGLFDTSKPHFSAWLKVYDIDERWHFFSLEQHNCGSPLYYAALCGLYDLAERLIAKHPDHVNAVGGRISAPLPAALYKRHFHVANLLHRHGAVVDARGDSQRTPLYCASIEGLVDIMRWLFNHGADANIHRDDGRPPLYVAAVNMHLEAVQLLLDHNAYVNSRNERGHTPLCKTISDHSHYQEHGAVDVVRLLLEHGADLNACEPNHSTVLYQASSHRWLEVARLLLNYGAKVDEKDEDGKTPFQIASENGYDEIVKLLSEHVVVP
ncbi:hypothetical protein EI94DRAFT_1741814 [Lactarius quietus]|nr:hypothetical protein EI94DRAFT_1741814 [Lactarius quietus]